MYFFRATLAVFSFCSLMTGQILFIICGYAGRNRCFPPRTDFCFSNMTREEIWVFLYGLFFGMGISLGILFLIDEKDLFKISGYCSFICLVNVSLSRSSIFIVQGLEHKENYSPAMKVLKEMFSPELNRNEYKKMFFVSDFFMLLSALFLLMYLVPFFAFFMS
jgi:hypothetical protein